MRKSVLLMLLLLFPVITYGSHATGAEISYVCLGNNQFQVNYIFYRDCSGIPAPITINLTAGTQTYTLTASPNSPVMLHTACPSQLTTCLGGASLGIEKWIYSDTITLPQGTTVMYHSENARSAALSTVSNTGVDLFVYALIENNSNECNNSPTFNAEPTVIVCQGNNYCIPPFVSDIDGDSLSFELIAPRVGPNPSDTIIYLSGYSSQQPLSSTPPLTINPVSGELCFTPTAANEITPIAILVNEYRNGVLIGQVERDMQLKVEACSNQLPVLSGFNGVPVTTLNVCADQQNCFFITSFDADSANSTFVTWDGSLSNSSTIHSFGNRDTLYICWTPGDEDTLQQHCFYATSTDNNCPYPGIVSLRLCLDVIPSYICNPVSIDDLTANTFTAFPQPASNELRFRFKDIQKKQSLVLYQVSGKESGRFPVNEEWLTINTSALPEGIYMAALTDEYGSIKFSKRIIIQK